MDAAKIDHGNCSYDRLPMNEQNRFIRGQIKKKKKFVCSFLANY
jgi:hypothetical protein